MAIRVATNITSQIIQSHLRKNQDASNSVLEQLSSGKRLNKASDDIAGIAISKKIEATVRSMGQAQRHANDGISFIQTAEGGFQEVSNMLIRLRELTIQSSSDTVGDTERGMLDLEYSQLLEEIDRISESTKFNNVLTVSGDEELQFHIGAYSSEGNSVTFDTGSVDASADGLGVASTSVDTKDDAIDSIEQIDDAIMNLNEQRAGLGAMQSRLHAAVNSLDIHIINHNDARSKIEDVDVAQAAAKLASTSLVGQSAIAALSQTNWEPGKINKLLG